ncbi:hypothetical protein UPYG_G00266860 [Umbra pygmaea]|uniref:ILEI/PANDER domain-containing protein n=1 Tax=Umbra pygmaea TaxID=75934 RepID=A0ABD0WAZ0_UMBPY
MLTVRIGRRRHKSQGIRSLFLILAVLGVIFLIVFLLMKSQNHSISWYQEFIGPEGLHVLKESKVSTSSPIQRSNLCGIQKPCPDGDINFYISSGAASVIGPKICVAGKMVMGKMEKNVGEGINIAVLNGKTGEVIKTEFFNMYDGEIEPMIKFLESIERKTIVMIASFDDPATKLNEEARSLIKQLGSSAIDSLAFRDNWVFVGGKAAEGVGVKSNLEKHVKNNRDQNKYDNWPEMTELLGCVPRYLE